MVCPEIATNTGRLAPIPLQLDQRINRDLTTDLASNAARLSVAEVAKTFGSVDFPRKTEILGEFRYVEILNLATFDFASVVIGRLS